MDVFSFAIPLFFILNPLGNLPCFVSMLSHYPIKKQRRIILRELFIALALLCSFSFFGETILSLLGICHAVVGIAGGILLFLISLGMIFPKENGEITHHREPFIFPLAVPLVAGPGSLAAVMVFAQQIQDIALTIGAILLAWIPALLILLASANIKHLLGQKGLIACERMGGMLICLLSVQMFTTGVTAIVRENLAR